MKVDEANKFWNSKETVKSFINQPISPYWMELFGQIKNRSEKRVLDLGCGGGRNLEMLAMLGFEVYGCDMYKQMVEASKNRLINIGYEEKLLENHIIQAQMDILPYKSGYFDIVLSHGVYHNAVSFAEFEKAIEETSRVLKKNGRLFFNLFSSNYIAGDYKKVSDNDHLFTTEKKLCMILVSKEEFVEITRKYNLILDGEVIEYESNVSTGKRSVMRGTLIKRSS